MKLHGNARTCPNSRRLLIDRVCDQSWSVAAAAAAAGISERTAYRWLARWREGGLAALSDRSSAPRSIPHRTPADRVQAIAALRRLHMTAAEIAEVLCMALSTVSAVLKRIGLLQSVQSAWAPPAGSSSTWPSMTPRAWPMSRCSQTSRELPQRASSLARSPGLKASASPSSGCSPITAAATARRCTRSPLAELQIRHLFTRPYRPRTNGKAERFIQTLANRWAYGAIYGSSPERTAALAGWLTHYNFRRPHGSLGHKPPGARLRELTNVSGNYS